MEPFNYRCLNSGGVRIQKQMAQMHAFIVQFTALMNLCLSTFLTLWQGQHEQAYVSFGRHSVGRVDPSVLPKSRLFFHVADVCSGCLQTISVKTRVVPLTVFAHH